MSIDSIRRISRTRRAARTKAGQSAEAVDAAASLSRALIPLEATPVPPPQIDAPQAAVTFDAQLLGQDGEKRGLRAGPSLLDTAAALYNRVQWSGQRDRRLRKGRQARTEI